jgi:hypothetical protein
MDTARLLEHQGHALAVATYGKGEVIYNVALECEDCSEVVWDKELDDE